MASSPGLTTDSGASEAPPLAIPSSSPPLGLGLDTDMEVEATSPSPTLPTLSNLPAGLDTQHRAFDFEFSSDPLGRGHLSTAQLPALGQSRTGPIRKRGAPPEQEYQGPRTPGPKNPGT